MSRRKKPDDHGNESFEVNSKTHASECNTWQKQNEGELEPLTNTFCDGKVKSSNPRRYKKTTHFQNAKDLGSYDSTDDDEESYNARKALRKPKKTRPPKNVPIQIESAAKSFKRTFKEQGYLSPKLDGNKHGDNSQGDKHATKYLPKQQIEHNDKHKHDNCIKSSEYDSEDSTIMTDNNRFEECSCYDHGEKNETIKSSYNEEKSYADDKDKMNYDYDNKNSHFTTSYSSDETYDLEGESPPMKSKMGKASQLPTQQFSKNSIKKNVPSVEYDSADICSTCDASCVSFTGTEYATSATCNNPRTNKHRTNRKQLKEGPSNTITSSCYDTHSICSCDTCFTTAGTSHKHSINPNSSDNFGNEDTDYGKPNIDREFGKPALLKSKVGAQQKHKTSNRKNQSFSNERLREINRHNMILARKIKETKPTIKFSKPTGPNQKGSKVMPGRKESKFMANQRERQFQIELENKALKRKIRAITSQKSL